MSLATRVRWFLHHNNIDYKIVHHAPTKTSLESGLKAHLPPGRVAKGVLLEDERGYLLAILPATCHLSFDAIDDLLNRHLKLAMEREIGDLFSDCVFGALPPLGEAYNVPMLVDASLLRMPDVYFEGGDHEDLVHVQRDAFHRLMGAAKQGHFGRLS